MYSGPTVAPLDPPAISTASLLGDNNVNTTPPASGTWYAANAAIYIPFRVARPQTVYRLAWANGSSAGNTHDIGIYDEAGTTKLVSSGATTGSGISVLQIINVADTLLTPGLYWLAYMHSTTTANRVRFFTINGSATGAVGTMTSAREETLGASVLPSSINLGTLSTRTQIPQLLVVTRGDFS